VTSRVEAAEIGQRALVHAVDQMTEAGAVFGQGQLRQASKSAGILAALEIAESTIRCAAGPARYGGIARAVPVKLLVKPPPSPWRARAVRGLGARRPPPCGPRVPGRRGRLLVDPGKQPEIRLDGGGRRSPLASLTPSTGSLESPFPSRAMTAPGATTLRFRLRSGAAAGRPPRTRIRTSRTACHARARKDSTA